MSFEDKLRELEEILRKLERGELTLDESVAEYERGLRALRSCREVLAQAERRIEEIVSVREPAQGLGSGGPEAELAPFEHEACRAEDQAST